MNKKILTSIAAVYLFSLLAGCAEQPVVPTIEGDDSFGLEKKHSIEVCKPLGEREYLSRLICPSGKQPKFSRAGSVGLRNEVPQGISEKEFESMLMKQMRFEPLEPGATDFHVIDLYRVECDADYTMIYMDMYHCNSPAPQIAPKGFSHI